MRKRIQFHRILKINWIEGLKVSVVYNNGESRVIDFNHVFDQIGIKEGTPGHLLRNPEEFAKMELDGYTLSWKNAAQMIPGMDGKQMEMPFEIGPDTLFKFSTPEKSETYYQLGRIVKENRLKSGLTQQELANRSGTTRNYISRIENNHSDIELGTLRKIIEIGLGKKMEIQIL